MLRVNPDSKARWKEQDKTSKMPKVFKMTIRFRLLTCKTWPLKPNPSTAKSSQPKAQTTTRFDKWQDHTRSHPGLK
jgi:hypothetical protein